MANLSHSWTTTSASTTSATLRLTPIQQVDGLVDDGRRGLVTGG